MQIFLFSAAIPGQGGESHINEQPLTFWRSEFARHDYVALDVIRPKLVGQTDVAPWYRYNCILYVAKDKLAQLPAELTGEPVTGGGSSFSRSHRPYGSLDVRFYE